MYMQMNRRCRGGHSDTMMAATPCLGMATIKGQVQCPLHGYKHLKV